MAKKALLVGINDYKHIRDLKGCVNDVLDIHFTLRHLYNFQDDEIRVLTDSLATCENILHRLEWLVEKAKAGDILVFHFSGHGSQIKDKNYDELDDHLDEIICPYDMNWDGKFITDDKLEEIFKHVPKGVTLEVFLDCCHSGNGMREMGLVLHSELTEEFPRVSRYLIPQVDIFLPINDKDDKLESRGFLKGFNQRNKQNHILWAACTASQSACDTFLNGRFHGAFTYFLNAHLRRNPFISRQKLLGKVRTSLSHAGYSQSPQLELTATRKDQLIFTNEQFKTIYDTQDWLYQVA